MQKCFIFRSNFFLSIFVSNQRKKHYKMATLTFRQQSGPIKKLSEILEISVESCQI